MVMDVNVKMRLVMWAFVRLQILTIDPHPHI